MFTADTTPPTLTNYVVSLSDNTMTLTFSETIDIASLNVDQLTLHNARPATASNILTTSTKPSASTSTVMLTLSTADVNEIQRQSICATQATCFLSYPATMVQDRTGNAIAAIAVASAIGAGLPHTADDRFQPELVSWEINMSTDTLTLSFNETVVTSRLDFSVFTIQDGETNITSSYALANTRVSGANTANYTISLNVTDANEIKSLDLCSSIRECYATFPSTFAQDVVGLSVVARADGNGIQAISSIADTFSPSIVSFTDFDLAKGEVKISFSEIVNVSTFDPKEITLQTLFSNPLSTYTLTGGTASTVNSDTVTVTLTSADLDKIKETENLCTHRGTCYLSATDRLVDDLYSNSNKAQGQGYPGLIAQSFTRDVTAPVLDRFELDLNTNVLSLTFSEPVRSSRLKISEITLQSAVTSLGGQLEYTLTGGVLPTLDGLRVVNVNLTTTDANQLKQRSFASSTANKFIRLTADTITDMSVAPNKVSAIVDGQAKAVSAFLPDITGPILLSFDLSLDANTLTLRFDEPMNWTSFVAHQLIFTSSTLASASTHQLSGGILAISSSSTSNTISLLPSDIGQIKLDPEFGTTIADTFLSFAAGTVRDVSGNKNTEVVNRMASSLTEDNTTAELQSFSVDINLGILELNFTDVVNASTFDARAITLQSNSTAIPGQSVTLTSSSATSSESGYTIVVTLSPQDLLAITLTTAVARSLSSTFLVMAASAIEDINGLSVATIGDGAGKPASSHIGVIGQPTTAPPLTSQGENGFVFQ